MSTRELTKSVFSPSLFNDFFSPWNEGFDDTKLLSRMTKMPAVNIIENGNHYNISLAAPGLKKDDFKIGVKSNMLTISSEKEQKKVEKEE